MQKFFPNDSLAARGDEMKAEQRAAELVAKRLTNFEELGR
jgi:hypothetical protein